MENIGAVLTIPTSVTDGLEKAQQSISKMSEDADKLASSFKEIGKMKLDITGLDSVGKQLSDINSLVSTLTDKTVNLKFDMSSGDFLKAVDSMVNAPEMFNKVSSSVDKLGDSSKEAQQSLSSLIDSVYKPTEGGSPLDKIDIKDVYKDILSLKEEARSLSKLGMFEDLPVIMQRLREAKQLFSDLTERNATNPDNQAYQDWLLEKAIIEQKALADTEAAAYRERRIKEEAAKAEVDAKKAAIAEEIKMEWDLEQREAEHADKIAKVQARINEALGKASNLPEDSVNNIEHKIMKFNELLQKMRDSRVDGDQVFDEASFKEVEAMIDSLQKKLTVAKANAGRDMRTLKSKLTQLFSITMAVKFVKQMVNIRAEFQMMEKSLGVLLRDQAKASAMFKEVEQIAIKSPFSVQEISKQLKQLAAYRIEQEKLIDTTKMLGDISAGVGADMNRLILAYGQVKAAEYLKGTELRQFSEAGVNLLGGLADRFSDIYNRVVSVGEVTDMVRKKMVLFSDVEAVLKKETEAGGTFFRMQEQQANTIQGRISNLEDRISIMFNNIGKQYTGLISVLLSGAESVVSNWKLVETALSTFVAYKTVTLIANSFIVLRSRLGDVIKKTEELGKAGEGIKGFFKAVKASAAGIAPAIGAIGAAIVLVGMAFAKSFQQLRELNKIENESKKEIGELSSKYNMLVMKIKDTSKTERERVTALNELKSEFGNILPLEDMEISKLGELNDSYKQNISAIREYSKAKASAAIRDKIWGDYVQNLDKYLKQGYENFYIYASNFDVAKGIDKDTIKNVFSSIGTDIASEIQAGTLEGEEQAIKEFVSRMDDALNLGGKLIQDFNDRGVYSLNSFTSFIAKGFKAVSTEQERLGENSKKFLAGYNVNQQEIGNAVEKMVTTFNNLKEAIRLSNEELYKGNQAKLDLDAERVFGKYVEYLKEGSLEAANAIEGNIKAALDGTIDATVKRGKEMADVIDEKVIKKIDSQTSRVLLSTAQNSYSNIFNRINEKYSNAKLRAGQGSLIVNEDETFAEYQKRIDELYENIKESRKKLDEDKNGLQAQTLAGYLGLNPKTDAEALKVETEKVIPMLKELSSEFGDWIDEASSSGAKSSISSLVDEIINTATAVDGLSENTKKLKQNLLSSKAMAEYGIAIPDFDYESIKKWIQGLGELKDYEKGEFIMQLNEAIATGAANSIEKQIDDLYRRYDTAIKARDWGIEIPGFNTDEIYADIIALEKRAYALAETAGEDALRVAESIKEKRLDLLKQEQDEAAELIIETQKKALTESQQALANMTLDISKIRVSNLDTSMIDKAINDRMRTGYDEVLKANWDAYKSTQMYISSFGDLDGLSHDVLTSLRDNLLNVSATMQLNATDAKTIQKAIDKLNEKMSELEGNKFGSILINTFNKIKEAIDMKDTLPSLEEAVKLANEQANIARANLNLAFKDNENAQNILTQAKEMLASTEEQIMNAEGAASSEQLNAYIEAQNAFVIAQNNAIIAQENLTKAEEASAEATKKASDATEAYTERLKNIQATLNTADTNLNELKNVFDTIGSSISEAIGLVKEFADAFGITISDEANDSMAAFAKGFGLVASAIGVVIGVVAVLTNGIEVLGITATAVQAVFWPLLAVSAVLGATAAIIAAKSAKIQKTIDSHKEAVDELKEAYDKLQDRLQEAATSTAYDKIYKDSLDNLLRQREELEDALVAAESSNKKKFKEEAENIKVLIAENDEAIEKLKQQRNEDLGNVSNASDEANNFASNWLAAFKETGDGLDALEDDFNSWFDNILSSMISKQVVGKYIEDAMKMINGYLDDNTLDPTEYDALTTWKEKVLPQMNEELKALMEAFGVTGGTAALSESGLQEGIQSVTEETAQALESLLNSTRFYVSDTNSQVKRILEVLSGTSETNPMLYEMQAQTNILRSIDTRLSSVIKGSHPLGDAGIKVFA